MALDAEWPLTVPLLLIVLCFAIKLPTKHIRPFRVASGCGFSLGGGPRLPWQDQGLFACALVVVGLGCGSFLLRRLPVGRRVARASGPFCWWISCTALADAARSTACGKDLGDGSMGACLNPLQQRTVELGVRSVSCRLFWNCLLRWSR